MSKTRPDCKTSKKQRLRLRKLLSSRMGKGFRIEKTGDKFFLEKGGKKHGFDLQLLRDMLEAREAEIIQHNLKLTEAGLNALNRALGIIPSPGECQLQTGSMNKLQPVSGSGARINLDESPLMRLYMRKKPGGGSYISQVQLQAGEQLRLDFERGQLQQKITASYDHPIGGLGKGGKSSFGSDLSDFALDSRNRLYAAMDELGPDLAGVSLDVCCFLKGLELVERERRWPPRSAKLMLATALSILARHYGFAGKRSSRNSGITSWGSEGYRPELA